MSDLVRRASEGLGLTPVSGRLPAHVSRAIDVQTYRAMEGAAKVRGLAYVAHVAVTEVAALSAEEGRLISQCPLAEPRLQAIVDTYTGVAAAAIARMGY